MWYCSSLVAFVFGTKYQRDLEITMRKRLAVRLRTRSFQAKLSWTQRPDVIWLSQRMGKSNTMSTFFPDILNALTLHRSPRLQVGLRENELWRQLRQDVVAKYLLGWRLCCWRSTHCVQKHRSTFLVLRPRWCPVVNVLEARRDLNRKTTDISFLYRC